MKFFKDVKLSSNAVNSIADEMVISFFEIILLCLVLLTSNCFAFFIVVGHVARPNSRTLQFAKNVLLYALSIFRENRPAAFMRSSI